MTYFAGSVVEYPDFRTVVQLIEHAAERWPWAPAVIFGDQTITYQQLDSSAEQLATQMQGLNTGAGDFVPLAMRNGPELPVAMIASMKLAAPFVPVDEAGPPDLRARMIDTLGAKVVLCSPAVELPSSRAQRLVVDVSVLAGTSSHARTRREPAGLDDVAYGFYTSGSTGTPKCALNIHRGILNRFLYMSRRFHGRADEVVLQNSRHLFDSSLWQILWPLTTGSRVVIPDRAGILDLAATVETIRRHRVTMTDFVPSLFNMLVAMMSARPSLATDLRSLRRLLIGGEEANAEAVQRFRAMLPRVAVINTYGPTEASIGSIFHEVTDDDKESIPIGLPIDNTYAVIVDDEMKPVAPGVVGEIFLGGDCLGLGYLGDPQRTRAAFVDNPFPGIPGQLLYRTGDLGRYDPGGPLRFAGRIDQQVKIGGVRIELSEIELALLRHPLVHEAKAIVRDAPAGKWLVAFVTGGDALDVRELRTHAAENLSPSLVPKDFIILERMPLNPNGKADRNELARLAAGPRHGPKDFARLSEAEAKVWQIWLDLLPVAPSEPTDDFFDLGGDSLAAQKLALALNGRFGTAISVRDVAEAPTIVQQARLFNGSAGNGRSPAWHSAQFDEDAKLPADISGRDQQVRLVLRNVLLTGGTGFIGAQILHDLLMCTEAEVYCLVRANGAHGARDRVIGNLAEYQLWTEGFARRIHALPGDLAQPRLGLDGSDYRRLSRTVDAIVHNGALVNLVRGYASHRAPNVAGTVAILRFATECHLKPVHYISTLSTVLGQADNSQSPAAEDPVIISQVPKGGYGQSKWVAERLLQQATERGVPVTIYRLGEVMPHSVTGVPSRRGLADLLAKACLHVGMSFTSPIVMDYTPVNWASRVVVAAVSRGETGYFHVRHPQPVVFDDLLAVLRREFGLPEVSYPSFWRATRALADEKPDDHELRGTLTIIPRADDRNEAEQAADLATLFQESASRSYATRTDRLMAEAGIRWPELSRDVFERYAAYHRSSWNSGADQRSPRTRSA
jgi:amino acid adenylation domain-containing protein/thioester reductase-like protein